jgi:sugar lactone lactonase YvrE
MGEIQVLASGYGTIEGPTVDGAGDLYYSDVDNGGVYRLAASGDVDLVVPRRKGVAGMCLHAGGGIVVGGRDLSHVRDGQSRVILGRDDYASVGLPDVTGFQDIHADDQGRILAGTVRSYDWAGPPSSLLLVTGEKEVTVLYEGVAGSNGLALDWTRHRLYHNESNAQRILVSDRTGDREYRIVDRFSTAELGGIPDGMALDAEGCIWVAMYEAGRVARFSPAGELVDQIMIPARLVTSVCFRGSDSNDLFIVSADNTEHPDLKGCVFVTTVDAGGAPVGSATV